MQILVLGMHRSGTSVVARLLNMMGAYFAPEKIATPPTIANPKGYWERWDVLHLNEDILTAMGMTWDNISDFNPQTITPDIHTQFDSAAREIIFGLDANRPWMIKDPRFCLLLPFWRSWFEIPVCVYVHRRPIQVAQSLKTHHNLPLMLGIALWEKYNLSGLTYSTDMPRILISHEELMSNPIVTVKKLHQDLLDCEVQGLRLPSEKEIRAFIDPKFFRERGDTQSQNAHINHQQATLFEAFENGTIFQVNPLPKLSEGAEEILQEHKNKLLIQQQLEQHHQEITQLTQEVAQRDTEITRRDKEIKQITQILQTKGAEIAQYRNQLSVAERQATTCRREMTEINAQKQELQTQLTQNQNILSEKEQTLLMAVQSIERNKQDIHKLRHWINALDDDIKAVFNSLTWRSGNILTQAAVKLMFKKAGLNAQDHIKEIMANIAMWELQEDASGEFPTLGSTTSQITPQKETQNRYLSPLQHDPKDYQRWIQNYDTLTPKIIKRMQQRIKQWDYQPFISIVMPTYNSDERWLRAAIESVQQQIYPNWELCIADDASTQTKACRILEEYAQGDERIQVQFRTENGHISAASNTAFEKVKGEFVAFLDHDDQLALSALFWVAKDIIENPDAMLWYTDEDKINEQGKRYEPHFKPDWNPDLFLSYNLITHLAVYRTTLIRKIAGFRKSYEGAQDYDLALRAIEQISVSQIRHIPRVLYHWRAVTGSTALRLDEKPYAIGVAQTAVSEYLERQNIEARVTESSLLPGTLRVQYSLPVHPPLISVIIPTYNAVNLLRRCVDSILNKTSYQNFEILIVDNASDDSETLNYLQHLEDQEQARIIDYPYPFNYPAINNMAVEHAQGELICLLNNDIEVINDNWLAEMVSHALRPEIGAVGARLWYPDETLQHGGVIVGIGGVAGHSHKYLPRTESGYFGRVAVIQNLSAVTAACMVMRKENFLTVNGLDAEYLSIAFNDVDLCLKISELGLRILWTPFAELYHHESASRGHENTPEKVARFQKECAYMKNRWGSVLLNDFAYNPNLTLETEDFAYAWPPRVSPLP